MPKVRLNDKSIRRAAPATGQIELWDDITPGFGLRIAAGGSRTFFVMKRLKGKLARRTVGQAPPLTIHPGDPLPDGAYWSAAARKRAQAMLADMEAGVDPAPPARAMATPTGEASSDFKPGSFGALAERYFADMSKAGGGSLKSKAELQRKVKVDLAGWLHRPVSKITRDEIEALIEAKHAKSPISANRLLALVKRLFRYAARKRAIQANPAMDIDRPGEEVERDRVLSLDELRRIWAGADALGPPFGPLVKMLILTAQRRSEVAGLRWTEIEGDTWRLPDARTKRGKGHLVPLSPLAQSVLKDVKPVGDSPLVFTTGKRAAKKGQKVDPEAPPVAVSGWSRVKDRLDWLIAVEAARAAEEPGLAKGDPQVSEERRKEILARYGLERWTLHDLRRAAATHIRSLGVDRLTVSKILNHSEGGITKLYDRYSSDPEKAQALKLWAEKVEQLCGLNVLPIGEARA